MVTPLRKRSDGIQTMALVKKFARAELDKYGAVKFNLDRVLEKSGVSRSSVYHHFGSRNGLIATVEVDRGLEDTLKEMEILRSFLLGSDKFERVMGYIEIALNADDDKAARLRRRRRIALVAASEHNKALAASLANAQSEGTAHLAETLQMMKDRGIINPTVPLPGIASAFQSLLLGRVYADITGEDQSDWVQATLVSIRAMLAS
ncbi:MAG: TetR/AcrR family transcriptional regulator [Actinomycetota bacterium]